MVKNTKIKLLHVMAGGDVGGAENIFLEDVLALADCPEIEQMVVTRGEKNRLAKLQEKNIPVLPASFNRFWRFPTNRAVKKAIREFQPDLIQYWMGRAGTFAVPEAKHQNIAWYGGYYNRAKRFPLCSYHVVLTKDLFRHVEESGVTPDHIGLIHTLAHFDQSVEPLPRSEFQTPEGKPLLLALARLHWKKGLDTLLHAVAGIPDAHLWIAGDGPLREELETLTKQLKLDSRVRFLGWRHDRERLLKACDIVTFPSRYEPFGTVTVDAWAAKKPLVAADAVGPAAYVRDGENGLLVEKDNVDQLRTAIQNLISDPKLVKKIVKGGWDDYQKQFTQDAFTKDSLAFYCNILKKRA